MKAIPPDSDSRWDKLLRQARTDAGPPADTAALLRAVRNAPAPARSGWLQDFAAQFASGRIIAGCFAGAGAFALVATWRAWDALQALPWAQLLDASGGGS